MVGGLLAAAFGSRWALAGLLIERVTARSPARLMLRKDDNRFIVSTPCIRMHDPGGGRGGPPNYFSPGAKWGGPPRPPPPPNLPRRSGTASPSSRKGRP